MTYMLLAVSLTSNIFQPLCNALLYGYFLQWCRSSLRQKKRSILVLDGISSSNPFSPAFGVRSRKASKSCWKGDTIHSFKNLGVWENETRKSLQSIGVRRNHEASQWHCHNMCCTGDEDVARCIAGTCWIIKEHILIRLTKKNMKQIRVEAFPRRPNYYRQFDSVWVWSRRKQKMQWQLQNETQKLLFHPTNFYFIPKKNPSSTFQPSNFPNKSSKTSAKLRKLFRDIWSLRIFAKQRHWNHTSAAWAARPWRTARSPRRYRQAKVKIPSAEKRRLQAVGCNGLVEGKCLVKVVKWLIDARRCPT